MRALLFVFISIFIAKGQEDNSLVSKDLAGTKEPVSIQQFLKSNYKGEDISEQEILNAIYFYRHGFVNSDLNPELASDLDRIYSDKKLPKGSWITLYRDKDKTFQMWMLELHRDLQPLDRRPLAGEVNKIIVIPIRVQHSSKKVGE